MDGFLWIILNLGGLWVREYRFGDIVEISERGILFRDGYMLLFGECRDGWCAEYGLEKEESCCVAARDLLAGVPYFLFYCHDRVKILFDRKGLFCKRKNENDFHRLQVLLDWFGFSSYDLS